MKTCTKCGIKKENIGFAKSSKVKSGLRGQCKDCDKEYRVLNRDNISKYQKNYASKNRLKNIEYQKIYRKKNANEIKRKSKIKRAKTKDEIKKRSKIYYEKNKLKLLEKNKKYRQANKDVLREKRRLYKIKRRQNDSLYKLKCNIRRLIQISLANNSTEKSKKTIEILGCDIEFFKNYLESKFEPWRNWENRGLFNGNEKHGWDLDHIKPISSATNKQELIELNHYTNFQPLCSMINRCVKKDNYG